MKRFSVLTIFPEFFEGFKNTGIVSRAIKNNIVQVDTINLRDYATDKHKTVDDVVYGGGPGMLLKPEPIFRAYEEISKKSKPYVLITEPWGRKFDQKFAQELSEKDHIMIICGRYEGVDERVKSIVDEEVSIGDFVLSGGEPAALVIMDAVIRLIPGVVGDEDSLRVDSFSDGLLGYPNYTRPAVYKGMEVPEVLRSGNHQLIAKWRRWKQLENTYKKRPELLERANLSEEDKKMLDMIKKNIEFEKFINSK
ncbi:tRNA (guanosine(37)-N1)-methyltransferase TrmD [Persephonella sp. KM09-Lau-8]|uniref:tRNA (guanosine(37)-N1)-methyltransferase TrmD n=1 Tax=Persephonella sp. KM09-Lau-8 TaxID=1158345 RepID=UPI00049827D8|nr:tRNA (guanosine(37)-N1)-methyltransferase TrmD [Persephonella sp. KM09-Lau-8]